MGRGGRSFSFRGHFDLQLRDSVCLQQKIIGGLNCENLTAAWGSFHPNKG